MQPDEGLGCRGALCHTAVKRAVNRRELSPREADDRQVIHKHSHISTHTLKHMHAHSHKNSTHTVSHSMTHMHSVHTHTHTSNVLSTAHINMHIQPTWNRSHANWSRQNVNMPQWNLPENLWNQWSVSFLPNPGASDRSEHRVSYGKPGCRQTLHSELIMHTATLLMSLWQGQAAHWYTLYETRIKG